MRSCGPPSRRARGGSPLRPWSRVPCIQPARSTGADLATELIPDARTLAALVFGSGGTPDASDLLGHAGRLVAAMERALVLHVDLNASNVLLVRGDEESGARVVDLDGCVVLPLDGRPFGGLMRKRLERSLRKLARRHARPIASHEWEALRAGYEEAE